MLRPVVVLLLGAISLHASDPLRPTFAYDVAPARAETVLPLLRAACGEGVRTVDYDGKPALGCGDSDMAEILATRNKRRPYNWTQHAGWEADGVVFGRFLSPTSEDAAVSCYACSTHPSLYGGTLLLTKRAGQWEPVWYKDGVITRHCRRITLASGRQILICEETDGGMGHSVHGLYVVDFTKPKFAWDSKVLMADKFGGPMYGGVQRQFIDRVLFEQISGKKLLIRVQVRHGYLALPPDYPDKPLPVPRLSRHEIRYQLDGETLKVTPDTAAAAKLFE